MNTVSLSALKDQALVTYTGAEPASLLYSCKTHNTAASFCAIVTRLLTALKVIVRNRAPDIHVSK
ncbi:hypothetical protein GOP47_0030280 [Adiantum capillus-veneris]|nr:hypothetical protein GOP47_0030280 [Adiantum capillus-veneris]